MTFDTENWATPTWTIRRLLEEVWLPAGAWIDPFAGNGHIIHAACDDRPGQIHFTAVELRPGCRESLLKLAKAKSVFCPREFIIDFSPHEHRQLMEGASYFDVAITNPPSSKALEALPKCLSMAEYVAVLQPANWLTKLKKQPEFLNGCPPDMYLLPDQICYINYAWFVWPPKAIRFRDVVVPQVLGHSSPADLASH